MSSKIAITLLKPILPYIPLLPTPVLSLFPSLVLHIASHPQPSSTNFISASTTHPLHAPLIFTLISIPIIYALGLISGNVSWVDRLWPFYTPFCSGLLVAWLFMNQEGSVYGHNLPRVALMFGLQILWSIRLLSHALKRDFYNLKSEDYRYTAFRALVPRPIFSLVHIFVIAIAQPLLLFSLSLPVYAIMSLPPSELANTSSFGINFKTISKYLPKKYSHSAPPLTVILNIADLIITIIALGCLYMEFKTDKTMYEFQNNKHSLIKSLPSNKLIQPNKQLKINKNLPQPSAYPLKYHPGFPTKGIFKWSRHANFASEQIFWLTQALFVIAGSQSSGVTRRSWGDGCVWAPCFALSILFCSSTFLTEWITSRKFPAYKSYKRLVGQFLPQETFWVWLIGTLFGTRQKNLEKVYGPVGPELEVEKSQ
ncbi:uncharacterized protein I206_105783 [Kwoniella pini CBS 10737]|uniref:Uncharacterized protein n=1 Tax=Kwoniella pini CBS 10737 TaxID=1296096 RepID=A0A1B9I050_9TREE|nr:uncharacterized protein I206_04603 [Kwoniella pini CBS 10737]OCF48916.1 hypothetical protein I206_04603 [Kwoniella pini CBS 10737]